MNKKPTTAVQVRELAKQMRVCAERFEQAASAIDEWFNKMYGKKIVFKSWNGETVAEFER